MPFETFDELEAAFQRVMAAIIQEWGGIANILNHRQTTELIKAITTTMQRLGMDIDNSLAQLIANEYAAGSFTAIAEISALTGVARAGINADFNRKIHVAAVQELILDTGADLKAAIRTAEHYGTTGVMDIVNNVTNTLGDSLITGTARKIAQRSVMKELANNGLTSFITSDGKRLPLDFYAMTVTRTKRKDANVKGQINRYADNGIQYVKILPHAPTCKHCAAHFGVIIQITGEPVAGIPHISNTKLPPYHPNCKCSMVPIQDIRHERILQPATTDIRTEAQRRAYEAEQKIRVKANQEKKMYERMKAEGVEGLPKTLAAFRRMKRKDDSQWKALQTQYRSTIQTNTAQLSTEFSN